MRLLLLTPLETFYQIKEVQANVKTSNNDDKINLIVLFNEDDIDGEVENFIESSGGEVVNTLSLLI